MIRFRLAARRELVADYRYYEKNYPGRGQRFIVAIEALLALIESSPQLYAPLYEIDPELRSAKVPRFPYRIVFIEARGDVEVIAVAHAKRRPAYWRRRLR